MSSHLEHQYKAFTQQQESTSPGIHPLRMHQAQSSTDHSSHMCKSCKQTLSTTTAAPSFEGSKNAAAVEAQELHQLLGCGLCLS